MPSKYLNVVKNTKEFKEQFISKNKKEGDYVSKDKKRRYQQKLKKASKILLWTFVLLAIFGILMFFLDYSKLGLIILIASLISLIISIILAKVS